MSLGRHVLSLMAAGGQILVCLMDHELNINSATIAVVEVKTNSRYEYLRAVEQSTNTQITWPHLTVLLRHFSRLM